MFFLDKLLLKFIIDKCASMGATFFLDPVSGAMIYLVGIGCSIYTGINISKRNGAEKK